MKPRHPNPEEVVNNYFTAMSEALQPISQFVTKYFISPLLGRFMRGSNKDETEEALWWLVDVPLFIDSERISRLYDVTIEPVFEPYRKQPVEQTEEDTDTSEFHAGAGGKAGVISSGLMEALGSGELAAFIKGEYTKTSEDREAIRYKLAESPQRRLAQILIEYNRLDENGTSGVPSTGRFHYIGNRADFNWEKIKPDEPSPKDIAVVELPSASNIESESAQLETILVPTAAEFTDGTVIPIYDRLEANQSKPPRYPQRDLYWTQLGDYYDVDDLEGQYDESKKVGDDVQAARKHYWKWFQDNFDSKSTTRTIEQVAKDHGKIEWIDFRLPLNQEGKTLHLHIQGRGEFNTGTFAYNLVKRGYKHGLRIVGTVKSEPDMDVLAVYER